MTLELIYSPWERLHTVAPGVPLLLRQNSESTQAWKTALQPDNLSATEGDSIWDLSAYLCFVSVPSREKKINQKTKNEKRKCKNVI